MTATANPTTGAIARPLAAGSGPAPGGEPPSAGQIVARRWRAGRAVLAFALVLVLISLVLAGLEPRVQADYLDPGSANRNGTRALTQLIESRGAAVRVSRSAFDAAEQMRRATGALLVVVRPERLTSADLATLQSTPGDVLLIEPTRRAVENLAPSVSEAGMSSTDVGKPDCALPGAETAGEVGFGTSATYEIIGPATGTRCYPDQKHPRLVQVRLDNRTVTVLGSGSPFTNQHLAQHGNAALGLNVAGGYQTVVWLLPDLPKPGSEVGDKSFWGLVPTGVKLAMLQLLIAVLLIAAWRMRRLGPIVVEALPVAVRSAETVEGRARLYRSRHARGRAAGALRAGTRERLVPRLGLPHSAASDPAFTREIVTAVTSRTEEQETTIGWALYGPAPMDDAELVRLSDFLDDLEKRVLGT